MANDVTIKFGGDSTALAQTIEGVKKAVEGIKGQIDGMAHTGEMVLGFLAVKHEIQEAMEHESNLLRFKAALDANGFASEVWAEKLGKTASGLAEVTGQSKGAIMAAMQMGLTMGIGADKLGTLSKQAVAMSALTHGSIQGSMRQLAQAQEGHFMMFNRYIPKLREAKTETEKMALVNEWLQKGWKVASVDNPSDQYNNLLNAMKSLRLTIGEAVLPTVMKFVSYARVIVEEIKDWVKAHERLVATTVLWTAGIAFGVSVIPKLVAWVKVIGSTIIWLVTSPLGLIVITMGLVASAIALLIGSGDTWVERWRSGMGMILGFLDTMLGSWEGFKESLMYLWNSLVTGMTAVTVYLGTAIQKVWISVVTWLQKIWIDLKNFYFDNVIDPIANATLKLARGKAETRAKEKLEQEKKEGLVKTPAEEKTAYEAHLKFEMQSDTLLADQLRAERDRRDVKGTVDKRKAEKDAAADMKKIQEESDMAMVQMGNRQLARDADYAAKRKKLPTLSGRLAGYKDEITGKFQSLTDKMNAKFADAAEAPDALVFGGKPKGEKVTFEDAASMYKRISVAAAGQDPLEKLNTKAQQQLEVARQQLDATLAGNLKLDALNMGVAP